MSPAPEHAPTPRSRRRLVTGVLVSLVTLGVPLGLAATSQSAAGVAGPHASAKPPKVPPVETVVDRRLFGVHDANQHSLDRAGTGSIRLWDTGVTWPEIFSAPGTPSWGRLDALVSHAHANGTEVVLTLGMTPGYAAADPTVPAYQTTMPDLAQYRDYVTAVMNRYQNFNGYRGIASYQVWNEANNKTFWTGTYDQMALLTKTVYDVRAAVDPGATVVAPSMLVRLPYQQTGLAKFYAATVAGAPVSQYVDVVSLNLYPLEAYNGRPGTPEDSVALLGIARQILAQDQVPATLPVWNTEVNYGAKTGAVGGTAADPIPDALQIAYVMRTYLLFPANGVPRVFWYAYDMGDLPPERGGGPVANTLLTDSHDRSSGVLTPAGLAFTRVQSWMRGTLVGNGPGQRPCGVDGQGTYTCLVRYASGVGRIYWNPYTTGSVIVAGSATSQVDEYGTTTSIRRGSTLQVDYRPVLVRSGS